jgi:hypothetical protein
MIAVEVAMGPLYRYTTPLGGESFLRRGDHVADVATLVLSLRSAIGYPCTDRNACTICIARTEHGVGERCALLGSRTVHRDRDDRVRLDGSQRPQ